MLIKKTIIEFAKLSSVHFLFLTAVIPVTGAIAMGEKDLFILTVIFHFPAEVSLKSMR
jgi:hypothetical protein